LYQDVFDATSYYFRLDNVRGSHSDLPVQERVGLQSYLDETGIVTDTRVKNPVCFESPRAEGAIVGTTLHVHVTHRKLFINETSPPYYCSKISCPIRDTLLKRLCVAREDARRRVSPTLPVGDLCNYTNPPVFLKSKISRYYETSDVIESRETSSLQFDASLRSEIVRCSPRQKSRKKIATAIDRCDSCILLHYVPPGPRRVAHDVSSSLRFPDFLE